MVGNVGFEPRLIVPNDVCFQVTLHFRYKFQDEAVRIELTFLPLAGSVLFHSRRRLPSRRRLNVTSDALPYINFVDEGNETRTHVIAS